MRFLPLFLVLFLFSVNPLHASSMVHCYVTGQVTGSAKQEAGQWLTQFTVMETEQLTQTQEPTGEACWKVKHGEEFDVLLNTPHNAGAEVKLHYLYMDGMTPTGVVSSIKWKEIEQ